jgi:hypothetical protein
MPTLALEKKNMKTIHTFNVKANRGANHQFSGLPFGIKPEFTLENSIFKNKNNSQKQNLISNSSKPFPMLPKEAPRNIYSNVTQSNSKETTFDIYNDSDSEHEYDMNNQTPNYTKQNKIDKFNKHKGTKKTLGILKTREPEDNPQIRKRVKTNEFRRKLPLPFKRANTVKTSFNNIPKRSYKTTNQINDLWKNKIEEEDKNYEESPRSLKKKSTKKNTKPKKSKFELSIHNEDSQKSNRKSNLKNEMEEDIDFIENFKRRFRSENVLDQMGREKSKEKFSELTIDEFEVIRELGKGHFGKVLLVRRKTTFDEFAVKLIPMQRSLGQKDKDNLSSEAQIFQMISSQFVVKAYYW